MRLGGCAWWTSGAPAQLVWRLYIKHTHNLAPREVDFACKVVVWLTKPSSSGSNQPRFLFWHNGGVWSRKL